MIERLKLKIQNQIPYVVSEIAKWNNAKNEFPIIQDTYEYYNDKLVSHVRYYIKAYEFKSHIERAINQNDCEVVLDQDDCLVIIRKQNGMPKSYITKYSKNTEE